MDAGKSDIIGLQAPGGAASLHVFRELAHTRLEDETEQLRRQLKSIEWLPISVGWHGSSPSGVKGGWR
jgi:hypothetical protein